MTCDDRQINSKVACLCVCLCVCLWERKGQSERENDRALQSEPESGGSRLSQSRYDPTQAVNLHPPSAALYRHTKGLKAHQDGPGARVLMCHGIPALPPRGPTGPVTAADADAPRGVVFLRVGASGLNCFCLTERLCPPGEHRIWHGFWTFM